MNDFDGSRAKLTVIICFPGKDPLGNEFLNTNHSKPLILHYPVPMSQADGQMDGDDKGYA